MMDQLQLTDLTPYFSQEQLIRETAEQVIKDFSFFDVQITFEGTHSTPYDELFVQIEPLVNELYENDYNRLYAILYRIDVSEKEMGKALMAAGDAPFSEVATDIILQRELKKVILRNYFKQQSTNS